MRYYSLKNILEYNATYNMIIGERSNGKTYSVLQYIIERFIKYGEQGAIVRRYLDDFKKKRASNLFDSLISNGVIEKLSNKKYNTIVYDGARWFLANEYTDAKGKVVVEKCTSPLAYSYAIAAQEHDKGSSHPNITTIVFDEFISRMGYFPDEFILFTQTVSTIVRERGNVTIFMLGNTVNKYCPYFTEMGLTHIPNMKQGTIDLYRFGNADLTVAVEYCGKSNNSKPSDKYFAFDNPKLQMITSGAWEIAIYPHAPMKIKPIDIIFSYFIKFGNDIVQCDIVNTDNSTFTYIHNKTTDIKDPENDLVFSMEYSHKFNFRRNITRPYDELGKKIAKYFAMEKVFYQNNEIGEIVRNYLQVCKTM